MPRVELMEKTRSVGRKIASTPGRLTERAKGSIGHPIGRVRASTARRAEAVRASSRLDAPRSAIERGRSNPRLGIAAIAAALLLIAWAAWAIYVTRDNGANAGLGVVLSWPMLLAALALIASPFVGLYFLVRHLRSTDATDEAPSISGGSADADAVTEEKPAAESEDEDEDEPEDEESDDEAGDEGEAEEDKADEGNEPEETDPDEEPPSGEKATRVSGS